MIDKFVFDSRFQDLLLACIIRQPTLFLGSAGILNSAYFSGTERIATARALIAYWNKKGRFPSDGTLKQVVYRAILRTADDKAEPEIMGYIDRVLSLDTSSAEYVLEQVSNWARERAVYVAIQLALTYHSTGKDPPPGGYVKIFEDALKVGLLPSEGKSLAKLAEGTVDPSLTLLGDRFLCVGGGCLLVSYTGVGKSTSGIQQDMLWSVNKPAFGIKPARALRILCIQAENDEGDQIEAANGVAKALNFTNEELAQIDKNTRYVYHCQTTGEDFLAVVARELAAWPCDLLRLDPLMAYVGADITKPEAIAKFLRNGLNPLLQRYRAAAIVVHHTPKPTSESVKMRRKLHEWVYAAAGSYDLMGWARACLVIAATEDPAVFRWIGAKRGKRLDWADDDAHQVYETFWAHSPDRVAWVKATRAQIRGLVNAKKKGRKERFSCDALLKLLEVEGPLPYTEWQDLAVKTGWSEPTFERRREELDADELIEKKDDLWQVKAVPRRRRRAQEDDDPEYGKRAADPRNAEDHLRRNGGLPAASVAP